MKGKIFDSYGCELITLEENNSYSLGRERSDEGSGLLIDDIFVSRKHATLGYSDGFHITDEGSRNGTFVNGDKLITGERVFLTNGDRLKLADREYVFYSVWDDRPTDNSNLSRVNKTGIFSDTGSSILVNSPYGNSVGRGEEGKKQHGTKGEYELASNTTKGGFLEKFRLDNPEEDSHIHDSEQIREEEENETGEWGPFIYRLRSSAAGRRLSVETEKNGCVDYQVRMIEENPGLMIGEVIHVRNLDNDCFLCEVGGRFSIKDYIEKSKGPVDGIEIIDRILKLVKLGEEHMLDRDKYFITPSTVFVDKEGEIMLVYIPHQGKKERCFSKGMVELCEMLSHNCPGQGSGLASMERVFKENICDTRECIKHVYHYKLIDFPKAIVNNKEREGIKIPKKYIITAASFVMFMVIFWFSDLNYINLGGILLMLAGANVLMYTIKPKTLSSKMAKTLSQNVMG